jgi:hypothetical protein
LLRLVGAKLGGETGMVRARQRTIGVGLLSVTLLLAGCSGSDGKLILVSDPLVKAGWNYDLINGDGSKGVHNPSFIMNVLIESQNALQ